MIKWPFKSFFYYVRMFDSRHGIPRPRTAPHLPSHLAGMDFMTTVATFLMLFVLSAFACFLFVKGIWNFEFQPPVSTVFYMVAVLVGLVGPAEGGRLWIAYSRISERSTHGTAQWATFEDLRDRGLARDGKEGAQPGDLYICKLRSGEDVLLPLDRVMSGVGIVGPQGSGKSDTILYTMISNWAAKGSAVILDPKGELYEKTAMLFKTAYRFDLNDAKLSDRWDFVRACRGNAQYAYLCASIILGVGGQGNKQGGNNEKFWERSETAALTALLLHIAEEKKEFAAASLIPEFIADHPIETYEDPQTHVVKEGLQQIMMNSPSREAQRFWGIFNKAKEELVGNIITGIAVVCQAFMVDVVAHAMAPLTESEREQSLGQSAFWNLGLTSQRAPREIQLEHLREPSTAIYIVVQEGEAATYAVVLSTFIGLANQVLRKTKVNGQTAVTPVLFICEEAGNLPIHGLQEMLGVGRGRRIGPVLVYQDVPAVYAQYGQELGGSILDKLGTKIFLAGLGVASAEYAAKCLGDTTVQRHSSVDVRGGSKNDQERTTDVQRKLMDATEIRQLTWFVNLLMVTADAPPIKGVFPPRCPLRPDQYCQPPKLSDSWGGISFDDATVMAMLSGATERLVAGPETTARQAVMIGGQQYAPGALAPAPAAPATDARAGRQEARQQQGQEARAGGEQNVAALVPEERAQERVATTEPSEQRPAAGAGSVRFGKRGGGGGATFSRGAGDFVAGGAATQSSGDGVQAGADEVAAAVLQRHEQEAVPTSGGGGGRLPF